MTHQVLLGDAGSVGNTDQIQSWTTERDAQRFDVFDGGRGCVLAGIGMLAYFRQAVASALFDEVEICFGIVGERFALQRV